MNKDFGENTNMMTITITMEARPAKRRELLQTLHELTDDMRRERGFLDSRIRIHVEDQQALTLVEEWETQDDAHAYMQSRYFRVLKGALKVLTSSATIELSHGRNIRKQHHQKESSCTTNALVCSRRISFTEQRRCLEYMRETV